MQRGWFNLFTRGRRPGRRRMLYRLHFADAGGNPLTLVGHKDVHDDPGLDVWPDTSTLYVRLHAGHAAPGSEPTGASSPPASSPSTCRTSSGSSRPSAPTGRSRRTRWRRSGGCSSASCGRSTGRRWREPGMSGAGPSRPRRRPADLSDLPFPRHGGPLVQPRMLLRPRSSSRSRRCSAPTPTSARSRPGGHGPLPRPLRGHRGVGRLRQRRRRRLRRDVLARLPPGPAEAGRHPRRRRRLESRPAARCS